MNNNKISKLKNLLLGTTVLTAALGFGAQAWGVRVEVTADALAAAGDDVIVKATADVTITHNGAGAAANLFVGSISSDKRVVAKQVTGNANAFKLLLSGSKHIYLSGEEAGVGNTPRYELQGLDATNALAFPRAAGNIYEGIENTNGAVAHIFGGKFILIGNLLNTNASLVANSIRSDNSILETTDPKDIEVDLNAMTNLFSVANKTGLTMSLSGAGAHKYTLPSGANLSIAALEVAENTGAVELVIAGAHDFTPQKFDVHSTAGVMPSGTMTLKVAAAGDAVTVGSVTISMASRAGLLSGNNTDIKTAFFKVEGTAEITGVAATGAGGKIPEVSVELAPQVYALGADVAANGGHTTADVLAGRYGVYNDTGLTTGAARFVNNDATKILDATGATLGAPAVATKQVNGKLTIGTADQVVRLSGKGEVDLAQNGVVAKFFNEADSEVKHGEFIFTNGVAGRIVRFSGAGAQTLTFSGESGEVELDDTSGDITLIWNDSTIGHTIPGLTAAAVASKSPKLILGSKADGGGAFVFSENVKSDRKVEINAPVIVQNAGALRNFTLKAGAEINSNIILDVAQVHVLTFDGGDKSDQVYNINARMYKGDIAGAGVLQTFYTAYNADQAASTSATKTALLAARDALNLAVDNSIVTDLNSVPLLSIVKGATVYFNPEKDQAIYVGKTDVNAEGTIVLKRGAEFHGEFANSSKLSLTLHQGSSVVLRGDSKLKNIKLGAVIIGDDADKTPVTSPQIIKFEKVASGNVIDVNAKLNLEDDIRFTGDTKLVLDVSSELVGTAAVAAPGDGKFTLSTDKLVISADAKDAAGVSVKGALGEVSINSIRPASTTKVPNPAAIAREVTFANESSFGTKDHGLKKFSVTAEQKFTMKLGAAAQKLDVYADKVLLQAGKDANGVVQSFILDAGTYTFNTSDMSVTSSDGLDLQNNAVLVVNSLNKAELALNFSVKTGKSTFGGGVAAIKEGAKSFAEVDFKEGIKFDGIQKFVAQAVNVTGSVAVDQAVAIDNAVNFAGSDVKSASINAPITLNNAQAKDLIFVNEVKKAGIEIGQATKDATTITINSGAGFDASFINGSLFSAKEEYISSVKYDVEEDFISSDQTLSGFDVNTIAFKKLDGNYNRVNMLFSADGKLTKVKRTFVYEMPSEDTLKTDGIALSLSDKAAESMVLKAISSKAIDPNSPLGLGIFNPSNEVLGNAVKAVATHAEEIADTVVSDAGMMRGIVGGRMAEIRVGNSSGDAAVEPVLGGWAQGTYSNATQKAYDTVAGYKKSGYSAVLGFDFAMNDAHLMGFAGGYVSSTRDLEGDLVRKDEVSTWAFNQYSSHDLTESLFVNQNFVIASAKPERTLKITKDGADVKSTEYTVSYIAFGASLGRSMNLGNAVIFTPTLGGRYQMLSDYSFEYKDVSGAGAGISHKGLKHSSFVVTGGMSFAYPVQNDDYTFSPEIFGGFEFDTNPHKGESSMTLAGVAQAFETNVSAVKPTNLSFNAGGALNVKYGMFEVSPKVNVDFGKEYFGYNGALKVRVNF